MIYALILSGGKSIRLGGAIPKQYIYVYDKPIIGYALDTLQSCERITKIVVVADRTWQKQIETYIKNNGITKFTSFADAGQSRQHSIINGLKKIRDQGAIDSDLVIIHDAARPCVTREIVDNCIDVLDSYDCSMPAIPVKDTIYISKDGVKVTKLLNRDELYAGQTPEGCHLGSYLSANEVLTDEEIEMVRGTSAIAFEKGLSVGLFPGSEKNYKITTKEDLEKFIVEKENQQ